MIQESLYHKTVDILVKAYFDDTLQHSNCYACAVGNIIAANLGATIRFDKLGHAEGWSKWNADWPAVHCVIRGTGETKWAYAGEYSERFKKGIKEIEQTGYTKKETAAIERAFELAGEGESPDEYMFNGLMAVIEVLDQIHDNTDTEIQQQSKQRFIKTA